MGSFKATLELNGEKFDVIWCRTSMSRKTTHKGKVATIVEGGFFEGRVEAKAETVLAEAMVTSQHKPFDWTLTYFQAEDEAEMRKTTGTHCYVVEYSEVLDAQNDQQAMIYVKIASEILTVGGATIENRWANNA